MTSASRSKGEDVESIAATLTKASKRALPLIGAEWTREGWGETLPKPDDVYSLWWGRNRSLSLVEGQIREGTGVPGRRREWQWRLTPLGLAVRAHLTDQEGQNR